MNEGRGKGTGSLLRTREVSKEAREGVRPIIDQCFTGIYRWHARRTLRSVKWVQEAIQGDRRIGLSMSMTLGNGAGYIYYVAVIPPLRASGVGGLLLDEALQLLRTRGAREFFASVRTDNMPSIRLLQSRDFARTGFMALARSKGLANAALLWMRMVVAPGEKVFRKGCP